MIGPSVWGLSEIVQSEKGPTVIGPSVIGQSEILAQTDGPQRPWAQIVLGQNEIQAQIKVYTRLIFIVEGDKNCKNMAKIDTL